MHPRFIEIVKSVNNNVHRQVLIYGVFTEQTCIRRGVQEKTGKFTRFPLYP